MKKKLAVLAFLGLLTFSGCSQLADKAGKALINEMKSNGSSLPSDYNNNSYMYPTIGDPTDTSVELFEQVLLSQRPFTLSRDQLYLNPDTSMVFTIEDMQEKNSHITVLEFAVCDLNRDKEPEVILKLKDDTGYIILQWKHNQIYGVDIDGNSFMNLKENGLFIDLKDIGKCISALDYMDTAYVFSPFYAYVSVKNDDIDFTSYYKNSLIITYEEFEEAVLSFNDMPDVKWYNYSDTTQNNDVKEILNTYVDKYNAEKESLPENYKEALENREKIMDSYAYLKSYTQNKGKGLETNGYDYYKACETEISNLINSQLELVTHLPDSEARILSVTSSLDAWYKEHEFIPTSDDLDSEECYSYGDKLLSRLLYLANYFHSTSYKLDAIE